MPKQQTGFNALERILVLSLQITQLLLFGVGTAMVWLSNIRGKRMTPFRPFASPLPRLTVTPMYVSTPALPPKPALYTPVYEIDNQDITEVTPVMVPQAKQIAEPKKSKLDPAFAGAMKSLGFTKAELQPIIPEIEGQNLTEQIRQALKLLNKPTLRM